MKNKMKRKEKGERKKECRTKHICIVKRFKNMPIPYLSRKPLQNPKNSQEVLLVTK